MFGYTLVKTSELKTAHHLASIACQQRDAAQAKVDRMTGGLRQNRRKTATQGAER